MKGDKTLNDPHKIVLDDSPTPLEEDAREPVRAGGLVIGHRTDGPPNLLLGDGITQWVQVEGLQVELIPVKVKATRWPFTHNL